MKALRYYTKLIKPYFLVFALLQLVTRLVFFTKEISHIDEPALSLALSLVVGFIFDLVGVFVFVSILITALYAFISEKFYRSNAYFYITKLFLFIFISTLLFISVSEYLFWDEFTSRFNFIAVDYLIYTKEVIGNIKESYPLTPLFTGIAFVAAILTLLFRKMLQIPLHIPRFTVRWKVLFVNIIFSVVSCLIINSKYTEFSSNEITKQITKNGIFEFVSAFKNNDLSYNKFYITGDDKVLTNILRKELQAKNSTFLNENDISREIKTHGKERKHNVVIITVESLSAEYMEAFGNKENITPNLDRIAKDSLFFKNLYAIGTRTVYGLSAITLSIPPVPGNAIVRKSGNENLSSLGNILGSKGYESKFIYGGFGYFDNMNYFFENNGYKVVDRSDLSDEEITFSNIWGVSDEDLFNRVLKENDESYEKGTLFFDMVMTTSNHRPFTYPEGKIDIPTKTGRSGGVKYTDYAIGKFIEAAERKPWFENTIFIIIADHTASSAGKISLDPNKYHIPLIIYAPKLLKPKEFNSLCSQIDLAPTLLSLLNISYESKFFGVDLTSFEPNRAFISNYQQIGYIENDDLIIFKPIKEVRQYKKSNGEFEPGSKIDEAFMSKSLAYFQNASKWRSWNKN